MKRIGIEMRMMKPFPTGIGTHFINLIHEAIKNDSSNKYVLIVNSRCESFIKEKFADLETDKSIEYVNINFNGGSYKQYIAFMYIVYRYSTLKLDLLITDPWCYVPFIPVKYYLMIYDLIGFNNVSKLSLEQVLFDKVWYRIASIFSSKIIVSSGAVSYDVMKYLKISKDKIAIIPPSTSSEYFEPISEELLNDVLVKYNLKGKKYIVYVGNRRPHKNLLGALNVFKDLLKEKSDIYFVLIGGFDGNRSNQVNIEEYLDSSYKDNVIILGKVESNMDVHCILNGSICLLNPTLFEGFGLTPLEAMLSGTVVVASDISPIKEVVQDAGILIDYQNTNFYVSSIKELLTDDVKRSVYIQKGYERSKSFTWDKSANLLIQNIS